MARPLVECVPNFSEGRDERTIDTIVNAIAGAPGITVLGYEADRDHNRSVVTFAGAPDAVPVAALRGIAKAVELIDLSRHAGVHPRIGAADVVPLVPVRGVSLEECVRLAHELGEEVWRLLRVPVYFYEAASRSEERRRLENVRRGGYSWLRAHAAERLPDVGTAELHPTAGATVIGARKFLIAFNVNLRTADVEIARSIARAVRESSGGLPSVKALGLPLESRGLSQVSMNLTDFERVGIAQAFEAVRAEAASRGVQVAGTELVGLAPRRAVREAGAALLGCVNLTADRVLEDRIESLEPARRFDEVLDLIASPSSPMGGGSASALAGALAAALGCMVARLSKTDSRMFEEYREYFAKTADRDGEAFQEVVLARKAASGRLQEVLRRAASVPAEMTMKAQELDRDLLHLKHRAPAKLQSDLTTALGLARACRAGAIAAARANLAEIEDAGFREQIETALDRRPD